MLAAVMAKLKRASLSRRARSAASLVVTSVANTEMPLGEG